MAEPKKDIVEGEVKGFGSYDLEYRDRDLYFVVKLDIPGGLSGTINLKLDPEEVVDKLAEAIPGKLDDTILGLVKAALFEDGEEG